MIFIYVFSNLDFTLFLTYRKVTSKGMRNHHFIMYTYTYDLYLIHDDSIQKSVSAMQYYSSVKFFIQECVQYPSSLDSAKFSELLLPRSDVLTSPILHVAN